jgi:hypothetical protein
MSGTANFISPYALGNLLAPVDGVTNMARFNLVLAGNQAVISISSIQQQMGNFQPQSVIVDNTNNAADIVMVSELTGWQKRIPAGNNLGFNFPSVSNDIFTFTSTGSIAANILFFDFPWLPDATENLTNSVPQTVSISDQPIDVNITGGQITQATLYTDASVTSTGASQTLVAANTGRRYILIGAPSASAIWVNFSGGTAGPNLTGCFEIGAGGFYESNLLVPSNAVTVYCVSSGLIIPCTTG